MKVYVLIRACEHTGYIILLANNANEAIQLAKKELERIGLY